jgi:hypothetical protein
MNETLLLERQYADTLAQRLDPEASLRWEACRSAHRFAAYKDKQLVIFSLFYDEPQTLDVLTCTGAGMTLNDGTHTIWTRSDGKEIKVGHTPVEVHEGVFLWHVFYSEISYTPYLGRFSAKLPVGYRSLHNIHKHRADGVPYILERAVFDTVFTGV